MTSYTGTIRSYNPRPGEEFPLINTHATPSQAAGRRCFYSELVGVSPAIGTDDWSFTVLDRSRRAQTVVACWIVSPVTIEPDAANYLTFELLLGGVVIASQSTQFGIFGNLPAEIRLANTEALRTLAVGDALTLRIIGSGLGQVIPDAESGGVRCYVWCENA